MAQHQATTTVGAHLHGVTLLPVVPHGAVLHPGVAHLAGEAEVVAEPPAGVGMEEGLRMVVVTGAGPPMVAMEDELPTEALLHTAEQLPTVEGQPMVVTTATALPMVVSTQEAAHPVGEVQPATQLPSRTSLLPRRVLTMPLHQAPMRHQLLAATELTLHLRPAAPWMPQHPATSLHPRQATAGTELHLLQPPHRAHGILRRRRPAARIPATIRWSETV